MNLAAWAEHNGVARVTAYRWFHAGQLPVSARKVGRLILVDEPREKAGARLRMAVYARVSSADQKADLDRQVARVTAWATAQQIPVDKVVTEVGSAVNGYRRKFLALLRDPAVGRIVVEHRDRFCRFGSEYVQAALAGQGRELVVVDSAEVDDDLVIAEVENPRPLNAALRELRHVCRARSRCTKGSRRYRERTTEISRLHRRVNDVRTHHLHALTTRLAKTHGRIVVEGLDAAGMLRQKGLPGARARRRGLSDAALGTPRRHLSYKTGWYGSQLVVADRWFPSSKTCHVCRHVQDIGWDEKWQCDGCSVTHQRDDNAAINLAATRTPVASSAQLGPPSSVEPTIRPGLAGQVAMKRGRDAAERLPNNPETGCKSRDH